MEKRSSGIKPESWLVSAGRASEPGAPLNVPLIVDVKQGLNWEALG